MEAKKSGGAKLETHLLDYLIAAAAGGVGSSLLTLLAMWRRMLTKKEHAQMCKLEDAVTKTEFDAALSSYTRETDLKLEAITQQVKTVEQKVAETKKDLSDKVDESKKDLSGKLNTVVALLTGKKIGDAE